MAEGLELKIARIRAGVRQYELAGRIGMRPGTLSEIECGRRPISPEQTQYLRKVLDPKVILRRPENMDRKLCDRIAELPSVEQQILIKLVEVLMDGEAKAPPGSQDESPDMKADKSPAVVAESEVPQPGSDNS